MTGIDSSPVNQHAQRLLNVETEFLAGVQANLDAAQGRELAGQVFRLARFDETDRLKALMAAKGLYDRPMLQQLPRNRRVVVHGYRRRWWLLGRRRESVAIASVLCPLEELIDKPDQPPPPIGLRELVEHLGQIAVDDRTRHVVAVCSPTGFTDEARRLRPELPNLVVVLVEPTGPGTWRVTDPTGTAGPDIGRLFDPEDAAQKLARVDREIASRSAALLSAGLSAGALARQLDVKPELVRSAFERAAQRDRQLRVTAREGETILLRGAAPNQEISSMSILQRIRRLFRRQGGDADKINLLAERRASLAQRRDVVYEDIGQLERSEASLTQEGIASSSAVVRRRLAAQLAQLRRDIARHNTTAAMLNQQINIISTHIHNLTLIRQGQAATLPSAEELTADAVRAEEMLEQLRAGSDLVSSLEAGVSEPMLSEQEQQILEEFERGAKARAEASAAEPAPEPRQAEPAEPPKQKQPPEPQT